MGKSMQFNAAAAIAIFDLNEIPIYTSTIAMTWSRADQL